MVPDRRSPCRTSKLGNANVACFFIANNASVPVDFMKWAGNILL